MNRRNFFGAMAGAAVAPALAYAPSAKASTFPPIVRSERIIVDCDISEVAVEDAAGQIINIAGVEPQAYRIKCSHGWFIHAKRVAANMLRATEQKIIVVEYDNTISNDLWWSLDALGVEIWSPGA